MKVTLVSARKTQDVQDGDFVQSARHQFACNLQIHVCFVEADTVDVADPGLAFIVGRTKPTNVQPQLQRLQAAVQNATSVVAILSQQAQARTIHT